MTDLQRKLMEAVEKQDKEAFISLRGHIDADLNFKTSTDSAFPLLLASAIGE